MPSENRRGGAAPGRASGQHGSEAGAPRADARADRGREAEHLAASFLASKGMKLVARNHRARRGEVDLVCTEGDTWCFVEVRSRTGTAQGGPEETVSRAKARRVVAAARDWLAKNGGEDRLVRFDVVAVVYPEDGEGEPELRHYPAAFDGTGGPLFG